MFDAAPTLEGPLLRVRPLARADFDALYALAADPLVWEQHPESNRHERPVFERFFDAGLRSGGALFVETTDGRPAGTSRYYDLRPDLPRVTIGYTFLGRAFWGGPHNLELKRLMVGHALRFVDDIRFEVGAGNLRSRRAVEKLGARLDGGGDRDGKPFVAYLLDRPAAERLVANSPENP